MGVLDIILLVCLVPSVVLGLMKGLIQQVAGICSVVIGAWLACRYSSEVSLWLAPYLNASPKVLNIICFISVLALSMLLLSMIGRLLTRIISAATLGLLNRVLGALLGFFKAALVLGIVISMFETVNSMTGLIDASATEDSVIYGAIKGFAGKVFPYLKTLIESVHV